MNGFLVCQQIVQATVISVRCPLRYATTICVCLYRSVCSVPASSVFLRRFLQYIRNVRMYVLCYVHVDAIECFVCRFVYCGSVFLDNQKFVLLDAYIHT